MAGRDSILIHIIIDLASLCVYENHMELDWDEAKRDWTLQHRGLDFASVAEADWDAAFTVEDSRTDYGEVRFVSLVPIDNRLCVVAWCMRGDSLRVISLRKANARERKLHAQG